MASGRTRVYSKHHRLVASCMGWQPQLSHRQMVLNRVLGDGNDVAEGRGSRFVYAFRNHKPQNHNRFENEVVVLVVGGGGGVRNIYYTSKFGVFEFDVQGASSLGSPEGPGQHESLLVVHSQLVGGTPVRPLGQLARHYHPPIRRAVRVCWAS